ncbi:MAG TPA: glycosyltransferase family 9 protein [Polaromonas sp.]|uniref:glycosyltransferase family 9 protein n=1 Tax=Polaromonas sp. TaxID=1869339 RepID=UPI002D5CA280|nr:glycosyltransferase family 9 protein [Polaromonas sp.]HYW56934.1 glycosyltransferase family 9 protein [Polaromonas sp.]
MKLGVVSESRYLVRDIDPDWKLYSFTISPDTLSFSRIFYSAFATPARYVQEIFLKLKESARHAEVAATFVFNPLFSSSSLDVLLTLAALKGASTFDGITVVADNDNRPVGYLLPTHLDAEDSNFLILLSTVDAELDATLCQSLFRIETRVLKVLDITLGNSQHNGFVYDDNYSTYRWVAERAILMLKAQTSRANISFTAVMPHHAGDVLFFTLAFNWSSSPIKRIAVNRAYQNIVDDNAPGLAVLPIEAPLINRGTDFQQGKVTSESTYFESIKGTLPQDSFYTYFRPSRDYNASLFHLIDHFAFALGQRFHSNQDLFATAVARPHTFQPQPQPNSPMRVLLHFDGGWALKVYPEPQQKQLIELLRRKGYSLTVLTNGGHDYSGCEVTAFQNFAHFKTLLKTHHLMVGMDSFPAHYAAHVLGLPTVCLFASTRPENSNAPQTQNYAWLEAGLRCRPCYGLIRCPLYGGSYCRNFVDPETVASVVERMLRAAHEEKRSPLTSGPVPASSLAGPRPIPPKIKRISLRYLRMKVMLARMVIPQMKYLGLLYREYATIARRDGFLLATLHTLRFLRKALR